MPEVAVPIATPLARVNQVELAHTGRWAIGSGMWNASREDFVAAVAALDCKAVRRPVLKLGHSQGEEPLWAGNPTGAPAVGYIDNLSTTNSGHTLVGDFVGMPGWLGDISASAYPDRSVEGTYDFRCQIGHTHPFVITAVALLGVTRPGVGTLKSLQDVGRLYGVEADAGSGTTVVARFDPGQPRWPDGAHSGLGGQWRGTTPSGGRQDGLNVGRSIQLPQGESLVGSGVVDSDIEGVVPYAVVRTPAGPRLRIGTGIADEDRNRWSAANRGSTANLDAGSAAEFVESIPRLIEAGHRGNRRARDLEQQVDRLQQRRRELIRRQYADLDAARAQELDQLDELIQGDQARIESITQEHQQAIGRLRPNFRADYDRLTAQIERTRPQRDDALAAWDETDRQDQDLFRRYQDLDRQLLELFDERRATVLGRTVEELRELDDLESRAGNNPMRLTLAERRRRQELSRPQSGLEWGANDSVSWDSFQGRERTLLDLEREREVAQARKEALAGDATPLPPDQATELAQVTAEFEQVDQELFDLVDGGLLAEGTFPGDWADLAYRVEMSESGPQYRLQARRPGVNDDNETTLSEESLRQLADEIAALLEQLSSQPAEVQAHLPGGHDQSSHGRRYGPDGNPIRRLTRGGRRSTMRTLNRLLRDLSGDEAANRPGMTGGPLVHLVQGIRGGVEGGQFTPDQALQMLSSLVFRPDVASNPALSTALAEAIGQLRGLGNRRVGVAAAAAEDVFAEADRNQLKHYWTRDPRGLAKWATKPHPWTALYRELSEHVGSERAKRIASEWFHLVFGYWPGDKRHRDRVAAAGATEPDWPEEEITLPNPNPTIIHAVAKVSVDDVRTAFYRQAPNDRTWIREFNHEPRELIVADDGSGSVARVTFDIGDDGAITFSPPKKVRVAYVEDDEDEKVAASRMVYASAAESRPSIVTDPPTPPGFEPPEPTEPSGVQAAEVSDRPWSDFTEADYSPEQWRRACLLDRGEEAGDGKSRYGLPVREPDGALNRNGVHAAAGGHGVGAVKGISSELRQATALKLVGLYRQIGDEPPESLLELAGQSPSASADPHQTPAAEPGNPTTKEDDMPLSTEVYQRLGLAEDADETAVNAAVMAALDKAEQAPDPKQVAAAAEENATLTEKVTLLQEQVTGLSQQIADDNAAKAAEVKASVIDEAVMKGRIAPADREKWAVRYDRAPDAVADVLASIADGAVVPVVAQGKVGDPWDVAASEDSLPPEPAWLDPPRELATASTGKDA